jgi:predicted unusual protein kinase regulating ubiquinone biosynthesis (AarF/ABC1/UbiB family)
MADDKRESTLFGEMRRMVRTSGAVGGVAARVAGERFLGIKADKNAHAESLKQVLGGLKGPLMKVAQFLATVPEALPEEYAQELATLQSNAPPMGAPFVRRRMQSELGPGLAVALQDLRDRGGGGGRASGQVHRATLPDGRDVACKLQYPDMPSVVEADLRQLKLALSLYRRMDNTLDNEEAYNELATRLREELGLHAGGVACAALSQHAARHARRRRAGAGAGADDEAPADDVLAAGPADPAPARGRPPAEERVAYAKALFRAWYVPFYRYGVIHGDPHLGNYAVREDADPEVRFGVNLLDFGVIRVFPPSFVTGVILLYEAVRDGDMEKAAEAYRIWGFRNLTKEQMDILTVWAKFLYEPLVEDRVRTITPLDDPMYGRRIAMQVHEGLKKTGNTVRVPREFPLMDRAAIGLGSVFYRLRAQANWHRMFMELVEDFDEAAIAARQAAALTAAGVPQG